MRRSAWILPLASVCLLFAQKQPFDVHALMKLTRISEPQVSPDGKLVAFTAQTIDLDHNAKPSEIYVVPVNGGTPVQITHEGTANGRPRWSPDSKRIAFISNRSGSSQVWLMNADGSQPKLVVNLSTEAAGVLFSPDGKKLVFTSEVFPDCPDDNCNKQRLDAEKNDPVKARIYTSLLYRHWTKWRSARRSHLLVIPVDGGPVKDITPGNRDVPPFSLGGQDDYAISPDSTEVCFAMNNDPVPATSTNSDLYTVPITGGDMKKITTNPGADDSPLYSPDGKYIAYRSQLRGGYESDWWRLMVLDRTSGALNPVTATLDRSIESFTWSPDSARLFFTAEDRGRRAIQMIPTAGGATQILSSGSSSIDDILLASNGKTMIYTEETGARPVELFRIASTGGSPVALTHLNDGVLANYALRPYEEFWVDSPDGTKIHSFVLKPPDFQEGKRYPVLFLIHGGPEGEWGEDWSYRWNAQVFAGAGYVVVMPNPRGSAGYGQKFKEEIGLDWGGKAFDDIMAVVDHTAALPYADPDRMAAAGGSYGGYMIDWMLGHTQRFRAFVSHAGVFDLRSMAGSTEELWFPIWEFGGMPWDNPDLYEKWSPSFFVKNFRTPTLVIAGEQDFRVPYTQSLQLFTALQMKNVPSKLIVYPDEGHWVLKPRNSVLWYDQFLGWIGAWIKKSPEQPQAPPTAAPKPPQ